MITCLSQFLLSHVKGLNHSPILQNSLVHRKFGRRSLSSAAQVSIRPHIWAFTALLSGTSALSLRGLQADCQGCSQAQ